MTRKDVQGEGDGTSTSQTKSADDATTESTAAATAKSDDDVKADDATPDSEAESRAEPKAKATSDGEAKSKAGPKAKTRSDDEAKSKAGPKAKARSDDEAKSKAEPKAKARSDDEAKSKAEPKAKAKAADDVKAKADDDVKAKADDDVKAAADAKPAAPRPIKAAPPPDGSVSLPEDGAADRPVSGPSPERVHGGRRFAPPSPGFVARIGLAVAHPRWALAVAGDRRHAGRSGSDLIVMCIVLVLSTQLTKLYGAAWIGTAIDSGLGLRGLTDILTRTLALDLAFLLLGAVGLWVAAGARRNLGRAFDLACSAALPLFLVDLAFTTIARGLGIDQVPRELMWVFSGIAWGWTGALLALALRQARVASAKLPVPPPATVARGRLAGWIVFGVAALGLAIQLAWLARHHDDLRPMRDGDPAPQLALPTIGSAGQLSTVVDLATLRGQVVVVDFWATWCKPCIDAMPKMEALAHKPGVRVLAVNTDDPERAYAMYGAKDLRMTLLYDNDDAQSRYGVVRIPHTVVIDREGMVRAVFRGSGNVAPAVDRLLK